MFCICGLDVAIPANVLAAPCPPPVTAAPARLPRTGLPVCSPTMVSTAEPKMVLPRLLVLPLKTLPTTVEPMLVISLEVAGSEARFCNSLATMGEMACDSCDETKPVRTLLASPPLATCSPALTKAVPVAVDTPNADANCPPANGTAMARTGPKSLSI